MLAVCLLVDVLVTAAADRGPVRNAPQCQGTQAQQADQAQQPHPLLALSLSHARLSKLIKRMQNILKARVVSEQRRHGTHLWRCLHQKHLTNGKQVVVTAAHVNQLHLPADFFTTLFCKVCPVSCNNTACCVLVVSGPANTPRCLECSRTAAHSPAGSRTGSEPGPAAYTRGIRCIPLHQQTLQPLPSTPRTSP